MTRPFRTTSPASSVEERARLIRLLCRRNHRCAVTDKPFRYLTMKMRGKPVSVHRAIACLVHGRFLPRGLHVHHLNEDKTDNSLENLAVISAVRHMQLTMVTRPLVAWCPHCGRPFLTDTGNNSRPQVFCGLKCAIIEHNHFRRIVAQRTRGQPPRAARALLRKLWGEFMKGNYARLNLSSAA